MAKSPTEQIRELAVQIGILTERDEARQREINRVREELAREQTERLQERQARVLLERENAVFGSNSRTISSKWNFGTVVVGA